VINHAYTLALYRAGDKSRLADVAFQIGNSLVAHARASAMDYFQRALTAGLSAERVSQIGFLFESWRLPVQSAGHSLSSASSSINRVAHIVGSLSPNDSSTQYLKMLVPSLRKQGIESSIF